MLKNYSALKESLRRSVIFVCLDAIWCGALSFLLVRAAFGRSLEDAGRIFAVALLVQFLSTEQKYRPVFFGCFKLAKNVAAWVLGRSLFSIFCASFLYFLSVHAILGLGLHPWQGFDIGFFVQATHNAFSAKALMFKNIDGDFSFFGHHFSPFLFLLHPLGVLPEAPFWLYAVQDLANAIFATMLFALVKESVQFSLSLRSVLLLFFWCHPFWMGLIHYEFHELSFAPPLVLTMLIAVKDKKWLLTFFSGFFLLFVKETAFFSVGFLGLLLVFFCDKKQMKISGALLLFCSILLFYFYFQVILPSVMGKSQSMFSAYYSHLGNSMKEVVLSPILKPGSFFYALIQKENFFYIFFFFGASLPFFSRAFIYLVPFFPDFALTILAQGANIKHFGNQYAGIVLAPLFFVVWQAAAEFSKRSWWHYRCSLIWTLCFCFMALNKNPIKIWKEFFMDNQFGWSSRDFVRTLRNLPKDYPVIAAQDSFLPFVSQRDNLIWKKDVQINDAYLATLPIGSFVVFDEFRTVNTSRKCNTINEFGRFKLCRVGDK